MENSVAVYCNNGYVKAPQCYIMCILPILFKSEHLLNTYLLFYLLLTFSMEHSTY